MPGLKFWVEVSVLCRNQYHKEPKVKESNDELWGVKKVEIKKKKSKFACNVEYTLESGSR